MRLTCPFCGDRDSQEFAYLGDATVQRPTDESPEAFHDYVFLRDNPAGWHREYWHHLHGCRSWLVVTRDTRTHAVAAVEFAKGPLP
jgi:methylglutamate dehydrogenase subunit B